MNKNSIADLVAAGDAATLSQLAESEDKELRKAARKAIHQLRTRGIAVPEPASPAPRAPGPPSSAGEEFPCLVGVWDHREEAALWLARPGLNGGIQLYEARIHERLGLMDFFEAEVTRKAYRELARGVEDKMAVLPCAWRFARVELEAAYARTVALGRAVPPTFARTRAQLGKAEPWSVHPALERWPKPPEVSPSEILALGEEPECRTWQPSREALDHAALKVAEADESRLVVGQKQRHQARLDALRRAVQNHFADPARRAEARKRLLDLAYLVGAAAPRRERVALAARAAAEEFGPDGLVPEEGHFAWRLFERRFRLSELASDEDRTLSDSPDPSASPLIITP